MKLHVLCSVRFLPCEPTIGSATVSLRWLLLCRIVTYLVQYTLCHLITVYDRKSCVEDTTTTYLY